MILEVGDTSPFKYRPLITASGGPERLTELLLDGQQRLTALWRSFNDTYEDRTYFVDLNDSDENGSSPSVTSERRYWKYGQRYPLWAEDPAKTLNRGFVPIRLLRPGSEGAEELNSWLEVATEGDPAKQLDIYKLTTQLRTRVAQFNLPYLFLVVGTKKGVVLDVFVKMNTRSVRLTAFDIIVAEIEENTGESLHGKVEALNGQVPALSRYGELKDIVLNVAALLQNRTPNREGYFSINWSRMIDEWELLVTGAKQAVEFFVQERVLDEDRLPSRAPLAPLIALWAYAPQSPDLRGNARTLLKRYLWRSFFTERYEKAAAGAALQDYRALLPAVQKGAKSALPPIFDLPVPGADEILFTSWPKKRDRLARAALLLSFQGGAFDLADGREVTPSNVTQREYHHLFPVAYLKDYGKQGDAFNALNCALVTWRTNRTIAEKEPITYLLERVEAAALGNEALQVRLKSHAIPFGPLAEGDYDSFLFSRAEILEKAIITLCAGDHWTPFEPA